jgi:hypothetical protein
VLYVSHAGYVLDSGDAQCLAHALFFCAMIIVLAIVHYCISARLFKVNTDKVLPHPAQSLLNGAIPGKKNYSSIPTETGSSISTSTSLTVLTESEVYFIGDYDDDHQSYHNNCPQKQNVFNGDGIVVNGNTEVCKDKDLIHWNKCQLKCVLNKADNARFIADANNRTSKDSTWRNPLKTLSKAFSKSTDSYNVSASEKAANGYKTVSKESLRSEETVSSSDVSESATKSNLENGVTASKTRYQSHCESKKSSVGEYARSARLWVVRKKRYCSLLSMVFCMVMAMAGYALYITNFVAEIIYQGDPNAPPGSDAQELYVSGVRQGSLSMLALYGSFMVYNLFHDRILNNIGE